MVALEKTSRKPEPVQGERIVSIIGSGFHRRETGEADVTRYFSSYCDCRCCLFCINRNVFRTDTPSQLAFVPSIGTDHSSPQSPWAFLRQHCPSHPPSAHTSRFLVTHCAIRRNESYATSVRDSGRKHTRPAGSGSRQTRETRSLRCFASRRKFAAARLSPRHHDDPSHR